MSSPLSKKTRPTYDLQKVSELALTTGRRLLTEEARTTALSDFGLTRGQVFAIVAELKPADFYKTMESEQFPGLWQDVYRPVIACPKYPSGVDVYCKVQLRNNELTIVVISFKKR